ncbi:hypothetical protein ACFQAS_02035 [Halopenitus salinus]|uniref:Uncharacterized protein n=1 Tax=Halopenitus salinus TaxID=1198295 RepID=A0ABD5UR19_9EURY
MTNDDVEDDSSGFKTEQEVLETASSGPSVRSIQLGEGISPTRILVEVEREDGSKKESTASIELINLCRHDAGDDVYDPESKELDYSELGRDIRMRTDALLGHRLPSSLVGTNLPDKSPSDP